MENARLFSAFPPAGGVLTGLSLAVMSLAGLSLGGCSTVDDPFLQTTSITPDAAPSLSSSVSPDLALAAIPSVGAPVSTVRQSVRKSIVEQTIVYQNATTLSGENTLTVVIGAPGSDKGFARAPSRQAIQAEMRAALPDVEMTITPVVGDNAYGTFGYAVGTAGRAGSCIYAWQLARRLPPSDGAALGRSAYAAQVRLRYCDPGLPDARIADLMAGLRLKPVSAQTFESLRSAAGTGLVVPAPVVDPVLEREPAIAYRDPVRRKTRPVVAEAAPEPVKEEDGGIENAATVPLPGETAIQAGKRADAIAVSTPDPVPAETVAKPVLVPLPASVAQSAAR